jgi:hypothetical protein
MSFRAAAAPRQVPGSLKVASATWLRCRHCATTLEVFGSFKLAFGLVSALYGIIGFLSARAGLRGQQGDRANWLHLSGSVFLFWV